MAEEKEDKEEDFAEQRRDGASHLEKDRRQEHPRNIQTCSLFLEERLVPNPETRHPNINYSPKIPPPPTPHRPPPPPAARGGEGGGGGAGGGGMGTSAIACEGGGEQ